MKVLITGVCGFVGSTLVDAAKAAGLGWKIVGIDNLSRPGSETNRARMIAAGVELRHGDLRFPSDVEALPSVDWIIDCAANPSVLAGLGAGSDSRQVMEHNLVATLNMLEKCKRDDAGFILLSTSRVYSIDALANLVVEVRDDAFRLPADVSHSGLTSSGVSEAFSTAAPISLYGASKLASETIALEYGATFGFPVWINRCGVLAGAGQFGKADQGIFAYWINSHLRRRPLRYIGFGGEGLQVRDCLHPRDLLPLLERQTQEPRTSDKPRTVNVGGGLASSCSLLELTRWCDARFGRHDVGSDPQPRPFDLPWVVLDARRAQQVWGWSAQMGREAIFEEIARHAEANPDWLGLGSPT